ncbi:hypothetical protein QE152_g33758 [Popillia japonica]|uniref:Uncharacterized protein n=1 Tax=Popillia japonica TaxID=7064 RepID=A0AAW1IVW7_POPJA
MEVNVNPCAEGSRSRKPKRSPEKWKCNIDKAKRHSAKTLPDPPKCNHKDGALQCKTLKMHEILKFHENFYRSKCKTDQDKFLLKYRNP